ncbi:MAG TPA: hypothetical protein VFO52_08015 [Longimicrobiales bacterium]|nr:hypothetical protein [Longimicrobiales bacterium]
MARSLLCLSVATSLLFTACAETAAPDTALFGRYTLRTINGAQPPAHVFENAVARIEFLSGAIHLRADQSFVDSTRIRVFRTFEGDTQLSVDVAAGNFRLSADTVHLTSVRGESYYMTFLSSGSLVQLLEGNVLIYRKN